MKKVALLAAAAAAVAMAAPATAAPTIVNGSFETATVNPGSGFVTLGNGSTAITGWVVGGLGIDYVGTYWQAAQGTRSIDLSGNDKGSISQLLTDLVIGQKYRVAFSLAGNPDGGGSTKVAVASDGGSQTGVFSFSNTGTSRANMGWQTQVFDFTATALTANLTFSASVNDPYGPALDNVSISAVPEPATWGLMILGFGAIGAFLRRRAPRRTTALA